MLKPARSPRPLARDDESIDYSSLLDFLGDKLDEGDLARVRRMLGLDHPDLSGSGGPAQDAARRSRQYKQETLQARHRAGLITEDQLIAGMAATRQPGPPPIVYDAKTFPNSGRLAGDSGHRTPSSATERAPSFPNAGRLK